MAGEFTIKRIPNGYEAEFPIEEYAQVKTTAYSSPNFVKFVLFKNGKPLTEVCKSQMFHVEHFTNCSVQTRGTNRIVSLIIELFKGVKIQSWKFAKFYSQSINKKKCFISVN